MVQSGLLSVSKAKAIEMAKAENTGPYNLEELALIQSREVHRALASNPNTPEDLLQSLWVNWPEAILENPIIDIWDLTQSTPLHIRLKSDVIWSWYHYFIKTNQHDKINTFIPVNYRHQYPVGHGSLEYWLTEDPSAEVRAKLAAYTCKPEVQSILARDKEERVRILLGSNRRLSPFCHRILSSDTSEEVQLAVAKNQSISADVDNGFSVLASSDYTSVRLATAANSNVWHDDLAKFLLKDENINVRVQAAKNSKIGVLLHKQLQKTNQVRILEALAENKLADTCFLKRLATSQSPRLRAAAAANSKTPGYLQIKLYRDEHAKVRDSFIGINCCGNSFFDAAVDEGDRDLKCKLADMSGRSKEQLVALATDSDVHVRRAVARRLKRGRFQHYTETNVLLVDLLSRDRDYQIRKEMVTDFRLNQKRLDEMAHDKDANVRKEVANHYNTGTEGLTLLLRDKVIKVRYQATLNVLRACWVWGRHNEFLPLSDVRCLIASIKKAESLLMIAAKDSSEKIRKLVAENNWTPAKVLEEMINDSSNTVKKHLSDRIEFPRDAMVRLAQQNDGRLLFKYSLTLTAKVLARLAKSRNEFTRAMAARNCRTPITSLRQLALDQSSFVKLKLEQNPKYKKL